MAADRDPGTVFVQVKTAKLRKEARQWAPSTADLSYGDALAVVSVQPGWLEVRTAGGTEGFIHESAVNRRKVILASSRSTLADAAVDDTVVVLAGKGFNDEVERLYAKAGAANYAAVDSVQRRKKPDDRMIAAFIHDGKLNER